MLFLLRYPADLLGVAIALLVGVVLHAVAQAAAARAFGDRLPAANGRLSLDPRRHFEPFGIIVMLISGIGWNKPVPLQEPRFRGGRSRYLMAILAGPLANLVLAVLGLVALRLVAPGELLEADFGATEGSTLGAVLAYRFALVNAAIGVLTLLPIPPLDGARILWLYAPKTHGWQNARYQLEERNIGLGIVVLLSLPLFGGSGLLYRLVLSIGTAFLAPIADALGLAAIF
ncbi:MAG TPA: site-2 protease family protein [Frankiaceae bacterium]|nr:site-2 protease family protein [Frankiaceae bacterium]